MKYVALYRREDNSPLNILKNAKIRQIATAAELNIGVGSELFIQIERDSGWYDFYLASAYRALEVESNAASKTSNKDMG